MIKKEEHIQIMAHTRIIWVSLHSLFSHVRNNLVPKFILSAKAIIKKLSQGREIYTKKYGSNVNEWVTTS